MPASAVRDESVGGVSSTAACSLISSRTRLAGGSIGAQRCVANEGGGEGDARIGDWCFGLGRRWPLLGRPVTDGCRALEAERDRSLIKLCVWDHGIGGHSLASDTTSPWYGGPLLAPTYTGPPNPMKFRRLLGRSW